LDVDYVDTTLDDLIDASIDDGRPDSEWAARVAEEARQRWARWRAQAAGRWPRKTTAGDEA
jgi:hypothetical protein